MEQFKIISDNETIRVYTPYNVTFVKAIKLIGCAHWDKNKRCWILPEEYENEVKNIILDIYGSKRDDIKY